MNGPLRSVFTDCNSVLLTLDIQDEKGKQKTLGKSCDEIHRKVQGGPYLALHGDACQKTEIKG